MVFDRQRPQGLKMDRGSEKYGGLCSGEPNRIPSIFARDRKLLAHWKLRERDLPKNSPSRKNGEERELARQL